MRLQAKPIQVEGLIRMTPLLAREITLNPYRVISYPLSADAHYEIFWASFTRNESNLDLYKVITHMHPDTVVSYICDSDSPLSSFVAYAIQKHAERTGKSITAVFEETCTLLKAKYNIGIKNWGIQSEMRFYFEQEMEMVLEYLEIKAWFNKYRGNMSNYLFYENKNEALDNRYKIYRKEGNINDKKNRQTDV